MRFFSKHQLRAPAPMEFQYTPRICRTTPLFASTRSQTPPPMYVRACACGQGSQIPSLSTQMLVVSYYYPAHTAQQGLKQSISRSISRYLKAPINVLPYLPWCGRMWGFDTSPTSSINSPLGEAPVIKICTNPHLLLNMQVVLMH